MGSVRRIFEIPVKCLYLIGIKDSGQMTTDEAALLADINNLEDSVVGRE